MLPWLNVFGSAGFGAFYGYVAIYIMKRYMPPLSQTPPQVKEIATAVISLAGGGMMGMLVRSIDGVNYLGSYGLGLILGAGVNIAITIWFGHPHRD